MSGPQCPIVERKGEGRMRENRDSSRSKNK